MSIRSRLFIFSSFLGYRLSTGEEKESTEAGTPSEGLACPMPKRRVIERGIHRKWAQACHQIALNTRGPSPDSPPTTLCCQTVSAQGSFKFLVAVCLTKQCSVLSYRYFVDSMLALVQEIIAPRRSGLAPPKWKILFPTRLKAPRCFRPRLTSCPTTQAFKVHGQL